MECKTFSHINNGRKVYSNKKQFDSLEEAISRAKTINNKKGQIHKVVSYKCSICYKFHIGKNGKPLIKKYF